MTKKDLENSVKMQECAYVEGSMPGNKPLKSIYGQIVFSESTANYVGSSAITEVKLKGQETVFLINEHHQIYIGEWVKFHFEKEQDNVAIVKAYELYFSDRDHLVKYRFKSSPNYKFIDIQENN